MEFIIVGKCLKRFKEKDIWFFLIHFKGVFQGNEIKKVILSHKNSILEENEEYIIHGKSNSHNKNEAQSVLYAKIMRHKNVRELYVDCP